MPLVHDPVLSSLKMEGTRLLSFYTFRRSPTLLELGIAPVNDGGTIRSLLKAILHYLALIFNGI
jgi:hypothetical protein